MTSAILYETLCELVHIENAWTVFSQIRQKCDVHQDLPQIVASVSDITGIPIYRINEAWKRVRHSFEAYPFRYEILEEDSALFPEAEGIHFLYAYGDLSLLERAPVPVDEGRGHGLSFGRRGFQHGKLAYAAVIGVLAALERDGQLALAHDVESLACAIYLAAVPAGVKKTRALLQYLGAEADTVARILACVNGISAQAEAAAADATAEGSAPQNEEKNEENSDETH